jgi:hypothetical protein
VALSPNVPKSRRSYEENQTDEIVGNTYEQIYFVSTFKFIGIRYCEIVPGDRSTFKLRPNKRGIQH